jgi:hypothetical protein
MQSYKITKLFTSGFLKGLATTEISSVFLPAGFKADKSSVSSSSYVVITSQEIEVA